MWHLWIWIPAGLVFVVLNLMDPVQARSPVWFIALFLYMGMVHLLWIGRDRPRDIGRLRHAWLAYIGLVLACGAVFEASLSVNGTGIGGMHAETFASFVLAFGDYTLMALASLWLIRKLRLDFKQTYFLAAGMGLSEGLVFKGVLIAVAMSPQWYFTPILLAFYALAYASFLALPLLIMPYGALWRDATRPGWVTIPMLWLLGLIVAFVTRLIWGLIYTPNVAAWLQIDLGAG